METEECVKFVQDDNTKHQKDAINVRLVCLLLTLNRFHKLFWCFCCCIEQVNADLEEA